MIPLLPSRLLIPANWSLKWLQASPQQNNNKCAEIQQILRNTQHWLGFNSLIHSGMIKIKRILLRALSSCLFNTDRFGAAPTSLGSLSQCLISDLVKKSQIHRLVWVGRDIKAHLIPPPPWAGTPSIDQVAGYEMEVDF